jgi:hypothetical protein
MDTDKDTAQEPYKPTFMHHFNREEQHKKPVKKQPPVGPQSIYAYFPEIPEGVDFKDYLKGLTAAQLEEHMGQLDKRMDEELEALRKRYHQKRQPILQAIDAKKKQFR